MTVDKETLKKRLEPDHLKNVTEADLKSELDQAMEKAEEKSAPAQTDLDDPKLHREYPFEFDWTDLRGKRWKGPFVNKVLSIRDRQMVGVMRAKLAAGVPLDSLDDLTQEINLMVAHMTYSLVERPDWAKDLLALDDVRILQELYGEVLAHEATFLGYAKAQGSGPVES